MNNNINEKYLKKLHHDILLIMDEVDRICRENRIHYYLMCGTCIGAMRHKGFIPWDDDLDIAMPFEDFNRFIALILGNKTQKSVLSETFYLRWVTTEKNYHHSFAKICLKGTVFQESMGPASKKAGIYVDVFPLYSCKSYGKIIEIKNRIALFLESCLRYKGISQNKTTWSLTYMLTIIISTLFPNRIIYKIMLMIIRPLENKSDYQAFFATPYPIHRMLFPKSWHGEGKEITFEDRIYICPSEAELYLKQIYGNDVMQLPPENKRKSHNPLRVVFSDGEEIIFEKAMEKIKYRDLLG